MSGSDFDKAVGRIGDCIDTLGDDVRDTIPDDNEPTRTIGYVVQRSGDWQYLVAGDPETNPEQFTVQFDFDIAGNIGAILEKSDAEEILAETVASEPEPEFYRRAGAQILDRMSEDNKEEFHYHLVKKLSYPDVDYSILQTAEGGVSGFEVWRNIYPHDDGFSQTEFANTVRSVVTSALSGVQFVATSFDMEAMIESQLDTESEMPRYIH